jgi:hypothetical protein
MVLGGAMVPSGGGLLSSTWQFYHGSWRAPACNYKVVMGGFVCVCPK